MSAVAETPLGLERLQSRALVVGVVALGACRAPPAGSRTRPTSSAPG